MGRKNDNESTELVIPEDLTELSIEELNELHDAADAAFRDIYGDGKTPLPEEVETLKTLASGIEAIRAEQAKRNDAAAKLEAEAAEVAERLGVKDSEGGDDDEDADAADEDADAADDADSTDETADVEPEAVAASGRQEIRVNMANRRTRTPAVVEPEEKTMKDIVFSPDGKPLDTLGIAKAIDFRLGHFNAKAYASAARAGRKMSERFPIATFNREMDPRLVVDDPDSPVAADAAIKFAVDESRLPGGSLVASGGWCAPSETIYDLCNISEAADLVSIPEIQINRGGINHTIGPDYSTVYGSTGFCYTEDEDIEGDYDGEGGGTKPCIKADCPGFTDDRLGYCGVCISAGILQAKGYPEVIANFIDLALTAHAHRVSASVINSLVAKSTAVAWPANQKGATAPLLTAIDLQAAHYRALNRMNGRASLEVILPTWTMTVLRADLARRQGVDLLDVPESRVNAWMAARNVSAQYVVDWQDIATTAASGFTAAPTTVEFLLFAAGTFVKGVTSGFTMENIYDSVGLGTNDYTALFTEDPYLVAKRCHDSRVVSVPICPDGATHIGLDIACNGS